MIDLQETKLYNSKSFEEAAILAMLHEVSENLKEKGYNPVNQIVGYLMSGDPGYISSHKEARKKIQKYERSVILEVLVSKGICDI